MNTGSEIKLKQSNTNKQMKLRQGNPRSGVPLRLSVDSSVQEENDKRSGKKY